MVQGQDVNKHSQIDSGFIYIYAAYVIWLSSFYLLLWCSYVWVHHWFDAPDWCMLMVRKYAMHLHSSLWLGDHKLEDYKTL